MSFMSVAESHAVPVGTMHSFKVGEESVLLIHLEDGFYATQAKCPHLFAPLEKGKLIDNTRIQCKFHRAEFDVRDGKMCKWANFPPGIQALNFLRGEKDLKVFETKEEDGKVWVKV